MIQELFTQWIPLAEASAEATGLVERGGEFFREGGSFMILLGITSVVGVAAVIYKFLTLKQDLVVPGSLVQKVAKFSDGQSEGGEMLVEFEKESSVLARLGNLAVRYRNLPAEQGKESIQAVARAEIVRLHAGMSVIDIVISVAPMLGLLGTASGLVVVFSGLKSNPDWIVITGGIGRALSTTIAGLVVAIPAIIAQGYFQRKIDTYTANLEVLLTRLTGAIAQRNSGNQSGR